MSLGPWTSVGMCSHLWRFRFFITSLLLLNSVTWLPGLPFLLLIYFFFFFFFEKSSLWECLESVPARAFVQASSLIDSSAGYGILEWKSFPLSISKAWLHCLLASSPTLPEATFQIYGCCAAPFLLFLLGSLPSLPTWGRAASSSLYAHTPLASNPTPSNSTAPRPLSFKTSPAAPAHPPDPVSQKL